MKAHLVVVSALASCAAAGTAPVDPTEAYVAKSEIACSDHDHDSAFRDVPEDVRAIFLDHRLRFESVGSSSADEKHRAAVSTGLAFSHWLKHEDTIVDPAILCVRRVTEGLAQEQLTPIAAAARGRAVLLQVCVELREMQTRIEEFRPELETEGRDFLIASLRRVEARMEAVGDEDGLLSHLRRNLLRELESVSDVLGALECACDRLDLQMRRVGSLDSALALEQQAGLSGSPMAILGTLEMRLRAILQEGQSVALFRARS